MISGMRQTPPVAAKLQGSLALISHRTILKAMLWIALFGGLQSGKYFFYNRMQELSMGVTVILFFYTAYFAAQVKNSPVNWSFWFFGPILGIALITTVPAYLFSTHNSVSMIPSVLANRAILNYLISPCIVFLYASGTSVLEIENTIISVLKWSVIVYLCAYFTLPLPTYFVSDDPWKAGLVTFDYRGYRLKIPFKVMVISATLFMHKLGTDKANRGTWLIFSGLVILSLNLYTSRSLNAGIVISAVFYFFLLKNKRRAPIFMMLLPLIILGQAYGIISFFEHLAIENAAGNDVRYDSYKKALGIIEKYPLLGMGMASAATITDAKLIWKYFFADDIGIVGIAYRYGIVGAATYMIFAIKLISNQISLHWKYTALNMQNSSVQIALLCTMISAVLNMILNVDFINPDGVMFASLIISMNVIHGQHISIQKSMRVARSHSLVDK
jgi:hypothetical protein